jgi:hypothetical protein
MPLIPLPPSKRAGDAEIGAQTKILDAIPALGRILNALPTLAMVLNRQRQLVLANQRLIEFAGAAGMDELCGLRPGEILKCQHALESREGCGTTEHCTVCGALRAIMTAQLGVAQTQICRLTRAAAGGGESLELEISAAPIEIGGEQFTIVCAADASGRLRREWLEHSAVPQAVELALEMEVLAAGLCSPSALPETRDTGIARMAAASRQIAALMREHTELASAEAGHLVVASRAVSALELLRDTAREFQYHQAAAERRIRLDPDSLDLPLETDPVLARHALEKIMLNALEATPPGGVVTAGCGPGEDSVEFRIHNEGAMSREVELQVFQRSFSTKGPGRGYGAYFARLIAERYLNGTVSFRSTPAEGTTFLLRLPQT